MGGLALSAQAQQIPQRLINDLSAPSRSEQFFQEGTQQVEREIQRLLAASQTLPPVLRVSPEVQEQQQYFEQLEPRFEELIEHNTDFPEQPHN